MSNWWRSLTREQQKEYIKEHPNSKWAKGTRRSSIQKSRSSVKNVKREVPLPGKKPSPSAMDRAKAYTEKHADRFSRSLEAPLHTMSRNAAHNIKRMTQESRAKLAREVRQAVSLKDRSKMRKVTRKIGMMTGILVIGAAGLSLATGVDLTFSTEILAAGFGDNLSNYADQSEAKIQQKSHNKQIQKHQDKEDKRQKAVETKLEKEAKAENKRRILEEQKKREELEYLKKVADEYINKVRENAKNPDTLANALREDAEADIVVDDNPDETASVSIASTNETDLTKALVKIEKLNVDQQLNKVVESKASNVRYVTVNELLNLANTIETAIPSLASIFVSSVSQRTSLSNRAKQQMSLFNRELARCRSELAALGALDGFEFKKTPLHMLLKNRVPHSKYQYELSYVKCEHNTVRLCEVHTFHDVETANIRINRLQVYGFPETNSVNVAMVQDSNFLPRAFTNMKFRQVPAWLKENGIGV